MIPPTPRQAEVLEFIRLYFLENGFAPSFRDIADGCKVRSVATIHKQLDGLEARGWIRRTEHMKRSIVLTAGHCPACGREIPSQEDKES